MPQHASADFSLSLLKSSSSARKRQALAEARRNNDHVFMALYQDKLSYKDMKTLMSGLGLNNSPRAHDILMSYRILATLEKYLEETDSWSFNMLNNYEFQKNVRQFDLDVAVVVGARSEHLLAEIYSWNIPKLKKTIMGFSTYASDDATILTVLVFRILNNYSTLEFTLQLALSRATLIKIHHEMCTLFTKIPGVNDADDDPRLQNERSRNQGLVDAYRHFVTSLLSELESTPFESVQQELFQIVRDLRSMFYKFADSGASTNFKPLEENSAGQTRALPEHDSSSSPQRTPTKPSSMEEAFPKTSAGESNSAATGADSTTTTPSVPHAAVPSSATTKGSLEGQWRGPNSKNGSSDTTKASSSSGPSDSTRAGGLSSVLGSGSSSSFAFGSASSARAQGTSRRVFSGSSNSVVSSLSEELPNMLQAFELARRREEYFKQNSQQQPEQQQQQQYTSPPATPSRPAKKSDTNDPLKTPTSSTASETVFSPESSAYYSSPSYSSYGSYAPNAASSTSSTLSGASGADSSTTTSAASTPVHPKPANVKNQSPIAEAAASSEQMVQVKMINGRMMMKVESGHYVDMQTWADRANTVSEVNHQSVTHPSYSVNVQQNGISSPTSASHAQLHTEGSLPKKPSSQFLSIHSDSLKKKSSSNFVVPASPVEKKSNDEQAFIPPTQPATAATPVSTADSTSSSTQLVHSTASNPVPTTSSYGVASIFQPWLKSSYHAPVLPKDGAADNTSSSTLVVSKKEPAQQQDATASSMSTLEFLKQNASSMGISSSQTQQTQQNGTSSSFGGFPLKANNGALTGFRGQQPGGAQFAQQSSAAPGVNTTVVGPAGDKSWIKGMIGNAEMQFPKNYTNEMGF